MSDTRADINRTRWTDLGLNGGVYIDDAEDRTNYLLDERERVNGNLASAISDGALLATMLANAIDEAEAAAESLQVTLFDEPEDEAVWLAAKEARAAFEARTLAELRKRWEAEDAEESALSDTSEEERAADEARPGEEFEAPYEGEPNDEH